MRNQRNKRPLREKLYETIDQLGHDFETTADQARRGLARSLRAIGPTVEEAGQKMARALSRSASDIDRSLSREGKRTSEAPPAPRNTRPGFGY